MEVIAKLKQGFRILGPLGIHYAVLLYQCCSDHIGRRLAQVVVMDAKKYFNSFQQFNMDDVRRELNKVYSVVKDQRSSRIAFYGKPAQSYGASPAIWDHTVLPTTQHM